MCPNCDPNTKLNLANLKPLNSRDHELIKKTFKLIQVNTYFIFDNDVLYRISLQSNRNSNPFKEAVDPKENPNYYDVVKEPMGKSTEDMKSGLEHEA